MKKRKLLLLTATLALLAFVPAVAQADALVLTPATTAGSPATVLAGGSFTFGGVLTNEGSVTWNIDGGSISFVGPAGVTFNTDAFNNNAPLTLAAGANYTASSFFDVFAALATPPGVYTGSFIVGITTNAGSHFDLTQEFFIRVQAGTQPVPEPATMLLLGSGLAGLAAARRRKRRHPETE